MDDAIKKVKRLAAGALVRKERFDDELRALEEERSLRDRDRALAVDAADDDLALQLTKVLQDLDRRIEIKRGEQAEAERHYEEILGELGAIRDAQSRLERASLRAPVDAALGSDALSQSAEEAALENVRHHIEELTARAELEEELSSNDRDLSRELARLEKKEAEAKAKAKLADLKKKKQQVATGSPGPGTIKKPKKTM